jgi:hypothetical protein
VDVETSAGEETVEEAAKGVAAVRLADTEETKKTASSTTHPGEAKGEGEGEETAEQLDVRADTMAVDRRD